MLVDDPNYENVPQNAAGGRQTAFPQGPVKAVKNQFNTSLEQDVETPDLGLFNYLPLEIIDHVLGFLDERGLACAKASCRWFRDHSTIVKMIGNLLNEIPRAKDVRPDPKRSESILQIIHFMNCQSSAAAQSTAVSMGGLHTLALLIPRDRKANENGDVLHTLFAWGRGYHGQLGYGGFDGSLKPRPVSLGWRPHQEYEDKEEETMPAVIACGSHHTCSISRRGELYTWGMSSSGELGYQDRANAIESPKPTAVPLYLNQQYRRVVSVCAGANHTLAITEHGELFSCGRNRHGQLGNGTFEDCLLLRHIDFPRSGPRIVSGAAGSHHSLALAGDGSLFAWGDASQGQLGSPILQDMMQQNMGPIHYPEPMKVASLDPTHLKPANRVTAIAAGGNHSFALTVAGDAKGFGDNRRGQLGLGDSKCRWKPQSVDLDAMATSVLGRSEVSARAAQVICGKNHTLIVVVIQGKTHVFATGLNKYGQLGIGSSTGFCSSFQEIRPLRSCGVTAVQAGDETSSCITKAGELYVWGRGDCGQLGLGATQGSNTPIVVPGMRVIHPDKTLRRHKRAQPVLRNKMQGCKVGADAPRGVIQRLLLRLKGSSSACLPADTPASE